MKKTILFLALFIGMNCGMDPGVIVDPLAGDPSISKGLGEGKAEGSYCRCHGWLADDALLQKLYENIQLLVDREYALPQNLSSVVEPQLQDVAPNNGFSRLRPEAAQALLEMNNASAGLVVLSEEGFTSYRSFYNQCEDIYHFYSQPERAAMAGHSEHETGLAADLNLAALSWLHEHAHEYGFVQSYPRGYEYCTGYMAEEWHWRYIGREAARQMKQEGIIAHEYLSGVRCDGTPVDDIWIQAFDGDGQSIGKTLFQARQQANGPLFRQDVKAFCQMHIGYESINTCDNQYPGWLVICGPSEDQQKDTFIRQYCIGGACIVAPLGMDDSCGYGVHEFVGARMSSTCADLGNISTCSGDYSGYLLDCTAGTNDWKYCPHGCHPSPFGQNDFCEW